MRKAFEMMGGSEEPERLVIKMKPYWKKFGEYELKEPVLQKNEKARRLALRFSEEFR